MSGTMEEYQSYCSKLIDDGLSLEELNNYDNFKTIFTESQFHSILNEKQKRKNKRNRTKKLILDMFRLGNELKQNNENVNIVCGTLTLDNYHINLKEDTYIRKINNWLKKHFIYAIVNKDYGSKTEREHYHFIGLTIEDMEFINKKSNSGYDIYEFIKKDYTLGFEPTLCICNLTKDDLTKTNNYLLKLNNHSNKLGTSSRVRVIKSTQYEYLYLAYRIGLTKAEKKAKRKKIKLV